jgi:hypothetical protein
MIRGVAAFFTVVVVFVVVSSTAACPQLAQLAIGEGLRDDLIAQCCTCLADTSTNDSTATCAEATVIDGEIVVPDDAVYGDDVTSIPCLCEGDADICISRLTNSTAIVVRGACVEAEDEEAPCASACSGVLSFSPIQSTN